MSSPNSSTPRCSPTPTSSNSTFLELPSSESNRSPSSPRGRKRNAETVVDNVDTGCDVEIVYEGSTTEQNFNKCVKHPGHKEFFIPKSLCLSQEHFQPNYQCKELLEVIKVFADLTVHIENSYVSEDRPLKGPSGLYKHWEYRGEKRTHHGSGSIYDITYDKQLQSWKLTVVTAQHVVFDEKESAKCKVHCFSDAVITKHEEISIEGHNIKHSDELSSDFCAFECLTNNIHFVEAVKDLLAKKTKLMKKVNLFMGKMKNANFVVLVSFPHGHQKLVSFGKYREMTDHDSVSSNYSYTNPTCPGSSGGCVLIFKERENSVLYSFAPHSCGINTIGPGDGEEKTKLKKGRSGSEVSMLM